MGVRGVVLGAVLALAAGSGAAASEPTIRVLLAAGSRPFEIQDIRVEPAGDGLRAGARPVGRVWRVSGQQPLRAGDLRVRGALEVHRVPEGMWVVNAVPLEAYVAATLGREVYPSWHREVLKAQAVVTRTFALHERARRSGEPWHVHGSPLSQVYGGVDAELPSVLAAARATRGQYLAWGDDRPILAVFHSASGGRTASAEEVWGRPVPYLVSRSVEDEEDSPDTYWRVSIPGSKLGPALAPLGIRVGRVREIRVVERSASGRARRLRVAGSGGSEELSARAFRTAVGVDVIRSTLFEIQTWPDAIVVTGSGHGHGVGMSQWGARAMAERGADYREILAAFYPGTRLVAAR
jgi:stage II sporulation protein D